MEELALLYYHVVSGDRTPVFRLTSKCLYRLRYLACLGGRLLDPGRLPTFGGKGGGAQVALLPSIGKLLRIRAFGNRLWTLVLNSVPS